MNAAFRTGIALLGLAGAPDAPALEVNSTTEAVALTSALVPHPANFNGIAVTYALGNASGDHVMLFALADVNDYSLDSAVFINSFDIASNAGGPVTQPIPEPSAYVLMVAGIVLMGAMCRRRARRSCARLA